MTKMPRLTRLNLALTLSIISIAMLLLGRPPSTESRVVVLATRDLPAGTTLTLGELQTASVPVNVAYPSAALTVHQVLERPLLVSVAENQQITIGMLGRYGAAAPQDAR